MLLVVRFHDVVPPQTRTFPECPESIETRSFVVSQGNAEVGPSRTLGRALSNDQSWPKPEQPLERAKAMSRRSFMGIAYGAKQRRVRSYDALHYSDYAPGTRAITGGAVAWPAADRRGEFT